MENVRKYPFLLHICVQLFSLSIYLSFAFSLPHFSLSHTHTYTSLSQLFVLLKQDTDIGPKACHSPFTGSYPYYEQDAATFASWNVDYVKFDGCDQPLNLTARDLTCNMSQILINTGHDFWFNFHCWYDEDCAACGTSFRMGPDHHDNWNSTLTVIQLLANRQPYWGADPTYGWPDPDFVYTGGQGCGPHSEPGVRCPGQTNDEYITEFSIWALAGGQIIFSSDPRNMTDFMRSVWFNTEILAVYNDTTGFQSIVVIPDNSANPPGQAWIRPTSDGGAAVALFNPNDVATNVTVHFHDVPTRSWGSQTTLGVRDLWLHKALAPATGSFTVSNLAPHATVVIKLTTN